MPNHLSNRLKQMGWAGLGLLLLTACLRAEDPEPTTWRIAIIAQNGRADFLESLTKGAKAEASAWADKGVTIQFDLAEKQPINSTGQIQMVKDAIDHGAKGIILAPLDHKMLAASVDAAVARGIAVVVVDSRVDSASATQIASRNRAAGRLAASQFGQLLGGKGSVILLRNQINSANTEEREEGFLEIMRTSFPDISIVASDFHAGPTLESAQRVSQTLLSLHPDADGIFASGEIGTRGMLAALRQTKNERVKLIGVTDGNTELAQALASGEIVGLLDQDIAAMGRAAIQDIAEALYVKKSPAETVLNFQLLTGKGALSPAPEPPPHAATQIPSHPAPVLAKGDLTLPDLDLTMVAIPPRQVSDSKTAGQAASPAPFWIGRYEITQEQWKNVMGENPSDFKGPNLPVENISWNDAMAFCIKLTAREHDAGQLPKGFIFTLPTEAQWEYAARAGSASPFEGAPEDLGWYASNSGIYRPDTGLWRMGTHAVGQKQPNAWGLYDMHGNVSEWCLNPYDPAGSAAPGAPPYQVLRGGCWWTDVQNCGSDSRHKAPADRHHSGLGLRVALSTPP